MKRKILVAYDGSPLSKKAIDEAKVQAKAADHAEIHIVTIVTPGITSNDTAANGNLSSSDAERMLPELEKLQEDLEALNYDIKVEMISDFSQRNPGFAIYEYADEKKIDLIIVGHRGLSNLKKLFLGSVSSTIAQNADCNVLIIN
jgi:nucleotide-binding universal stress UspA family protein